MRRLILALGFLVLAAPAWAQRDGLYDVTGTNLDGSAYTGLVQIRSVGLTSFNIVWRIGDLLVEGVGMASGRSVAVTYGMAQRPGMGIYQLNPDGSMEGEWTIVGAPAVGRERLVPRPEQPAQAPAGDATPPPSATPAPATPR